MKISHSFTNSYPNLYFSYIEPQNYQPYFGTEPNLGGFPSPHNQQHRVTVTSLLDSGLPENVLSEEKSQEIIDLIKERFNEKDHAPVAKQKETLLEGDRNDDSHMMSRKMMQTYIGSYWWHFHPQLPICKPVYFNFTFLPGLLKSRIYNFYACSFFHLSCSPK